jgi:hypothetical protein
MKGYCCHRVTDRGTNPGYYALCLDEFMMVGTTFSRTETWVAWLRGTPAGYLELIGRSKQDGVKVEIAYLD